MPDSFITLVGKDKRGDRKGKVIPDWAAVPLRGGKQCLVVTKNEKNIDVIALWERTHTIFGRKKKKGCHVILEHSSISRRHAMIVCDGRKFYLTDLGSAHGTKIDDRKIESGVLAELRENSVITFGHSTRSYVMKGIDDEEDQEEKSIPNDVSQISLPVSFGANKKKKTEMIKCSFDSFERKDEKSSTREERERQIEAATRSFLSSSDKPSSSVSTATTTTAAMTTKSSTKRKVSSIRNNVVTSYCLPVTHEADVTEVSQHKKSVSCIAIDRSGSRMSTGSFDYEVKMWDFHGMRDKRRPFRQFEAIEGHPVLSLSYSPTGDRLLIGTGESRCKIVDRNGNEMLVFRKGDPYLHDMSRM